MARKKGWLRSQVEVFPARCFTAVSYVLPRGVALSLGRGLGRLVCRCSPAYRRPAEANVQRALGLDADQARRVVGESYAAMGETFVGFATLHRGMGWDDLTIEGLEHAHAARDSGRGVLACTGHFGAWEFLIPVLARHLRAPHLVSRLRNDILLDMLRRRCGDALVSIIPKYSGRDLARLMGQGACVMTMLDQNAGRNGAVVDFLGRPARQHTVAGRLADRFEALVLPVYILREDGKLRVVFEAPLSFDPALGSEDRVLAITRGLSESLEARVRAAPGQWNWIHDRWHNATDERS